MHVLSKSEIVAEADLETIRPIADLVVDAVPVSILKRPAGSMIMVKHVDPLYHTAFYMGEAHVTECEVDLDGTLGYGCVLGDNAERALCAAILDAVLASDHVVRDEVDARLQRAGEALLERRRDESRNVAATRVDFDLK